MQPDMSPRRDIPREVEEAARKLNDLLKNDASLPRYDIAFFRDRDGAGVGIRFYGDLPIGFELPDKIDGVRIKQR